MISQLVQVSRFARSMFSSLRSFARFRNQTCRSLSVLSAVLQSIEPEPRSCIPRGFADYWTRQLCAFARILQSGKIRTMIGWQDCGTLLLVECNLTSTVLIFREETERPREKRGVRRIIDSGFKVFNFKNVRLSSSVFPRSPFSSFSLIFRFLSKFSSDIFFAQTERYERVFHGDP